MKSIITTILISFIVSLAAAVTFFYSEKWLKKIRSEKPKMLLILVSSLLVFCCLLIIIFNKSLYLPKFELPTDSISFIHFNNFKITIIAFVIYIFVIFFRLLTIPRPKTLSETRFVTENIHIDCAIISYTLLTLRFIQFRNYQFDTSLTIYTAIYLCLLSLFVILTIIQIMLGRRQTNNNKARSILLNLLKLFISFFQLISALNYFFNI